MLSTRINHNSTIFKTTNGETDKYEAEAENDIIITKSEKFYPYHVHEKIILTDEYEIIYNSLANRNICKRF